jgi:hypothetical protein
LFKSIGIEKTIFLTAAAVLRNGFMLPLLKMDEKVIKNPNVVLLNVTSQYLGKGLSSHEVHIVITLMKYHKKS